MIMYFPNKYESWPGFLSVYVIVRSNGINVVYKLHYLCGVVISLKLRQCQSMNITLINNIVVSLILPHALRGNVPVRLKLQLSKQ